MIMFIATTQSPQPDIDKEKATEDFLHLLGRACEYIKELEKINKISKGVYIPLYEDICNNAREAINENWSN